MPNGIFTLSAEAYAADPCETPSLTASLAKILCNESPLHCWTASPRLNPDYKSEEKEIFDLGTVAHALMLQGIEHACVLDFDDWRKGEAKKAREEARAKGDTPILSKHWDRVKAMVEAGKRQIAEHKDAGDAFTDGAAEVTIVWDDHATDGTVVRCRARIDWLKTDYRRVFDYKSTGTSINPESISRYVVNSDWHIQAQFYLRGIKALTGIDAEFLFVAQETAEPYALVIVGMGPDFLWAGDAKVQEAIDIWARCMTSGVWPGYPNRIVYPILPSYEETRITERQLREA